MAHPNTLLLIRHGEKPVNNDVGVDWHGNADQDGLIPKGWARAGALATLFDANGDTLRSTLPVPDALVSPLYGTPTHRTYLTLQPLADRLKLDVIRQYQVSCAKTVAQSLAGIDAAVVLVCWEHKELVDIVGAFPDYATVTNLGDLPSKWPDGRFDVIWRFDNGNHGWTFSTADQQLLHGDVFD